MVQRTARPFGERGKGCAQSWPGGPSSAKRAAALGSACFGSVWEVVTGGLGCFGVVLGGLGSFLRVPRWYGIVRVLERSGVVWGGLGSFLCVFGWSGVVWDGLGWSGWARLWARFNLFGAGHGWSSGLVWGGLGLRSLLHVSDGPGCLV